MRDGYRYLPNFQARQLSSIVDDKGRKIISGRQPPKQSKEPEFTWSEIKHNLSGVVITNANPCLDVYDPT